MTICLAPGGAAGVIAGLVLAVAGLPLIGAAAFVLATAVIALWLWHRAPGVLIRSLGASLSDEWEHPRLHNLVDGLCATMGLPRPTVCVVDSPVPNAMAVGRDPDSASLVVTSGLECSLTLVELEGALAHELVHIKRQDTAAAGVAVVVAAPVAALIGLGKATEWVHALIGQGRELSADQRASAVVRYPPGIASALDTMVSGEHAGSPWPPGRGRLAALTRWLWIDPMVGAQAGDPTAGNLDDTRVRSAALALD